MQEKTKGRFIEQQAIKKNARKAYQEEERKENNIIKKGKITKDLMSVAINLYSLDNPEIKIFYRDTYLFFI